MAPDLTARQQGILDVIEKQLRQRGYPPSVREIGEAVGLTSTSTVHSHLQTLEELGYLRRDPTKPRAIEVRYDPSSGATAERRPVRHVPLVGDVAAGTDVLAQENIEELLPIPADFTGEGQLFMLRVRGDSMIDDGILDGDYIFVRKQIQASQGEIVVAMIEDEATVKRFYPEGDRIRFQPATARYKPISVSREEFRETQIIGVVVGVYRKV